MAPSNVVNFPCTHDAGCVQSERIALLEAAAKTRKEQLDRIEQKLDRVQWWLLSLSVSAVGGLAIALIGILAAHLTSRLK